MSTSSTNTLGKYQIIREIARSNDIVYEAVDPSINRRIALKELCIPPNVQGAQRRERIERFWREGRAAGKLSHPNIVTIYEVGKENDRHFIAMEYLEGQTLRDVMQVGGPMSIKDAVNYTLQLCSALAYAHSNGVVHRDIKPENVQILPGGLVKLTDFGIARLMGEPTITQNGQVFGTPSYMSPEQVAGKNIDARSDIFSVGVMLYEMIAGHKPFSGDSVVTITYNIMNMEPPPPPGAPQYIVSAIRKAMSKDPNMRYSTADEMANDLREERVANGFSFTQTNMNSVPSPFGGVQQSQYQYQQPDPQPPLTPYGTAMPSPGAGSAAPDPFAAQPVSIPAPKQYAPPKPMLSPETKNFLGLFFLAIGVAGMLIFAIWAVNLGYSSFQTAQTSGDAQKYYDDAQKLYQKGDLAGAEDKWADAIKVSPHSKVADRARNQLYIVSVGLARQYYDANNAEMMKNQANTLIEAKPNQPEGHFYLGAAYQLENNIKKAEYEFEQANNYGGNDDYAQASRKRLVALYVNEGDSCATANKPQDAITAYENAKKYADSDTLPQIEQRIQNINYSSSK